MKKCRVCRSENEISEFTPDRLGRFGVASTCKECQKTKLLTKERSEIKRVEIKKVGAKTLSRIKEKGSETAVFLRIWRDRQRLCINCGQEVKFFDVSCFAHILPKGRYEKWRYDERNIAIVHSVFSRKDEEGKTYTCHGELDTKLSGLKKTFEEILESNKKQEEIDDFLRNL